MEVKTLQDIFIKILRSEHTDTELDCAVKEQLTTEILSALYTLSARHDLAHIVANALHKYELLCNDDVSSKFNNAAVLVLYRHEQMRYAYKQICNTFDEAKIPYIPLKGSVIRSYYPQPWMRTSCDIDILVKEENLDAAIHALTQKGYKCGEKNITRHRCFYQ